MTDKEKLQAIKEEIERRYNCEKYYPLDREANVAAAVLQELLLFIDSIPEEPASEDLEEYYKKEFLPKEWFAKSGQRTVSEFNFFTAKHFAEWQKKKAMQDFLEKAKEFFIEQHAGMFTQFKNYMQDESEN